MTHEVPGVDRAAGKRRSKDAPVWDVVMRVSPGASTATVSLFPHRQTAQDLIDWSRARWELPQGLQYRLSTDAGVAIPPNTRLASVDGLRSGSTLAVEPYGTEPQKSEDPASLAKLLVIGPSGRSLAVETDLLTTTSEDLVRFAAQRIGDPKDEYLLLARDSYVPPGMPLRFSGLGDGDRVELEVARMPHSTPSAGGGEATPTVPQVGGDSSAGSDGAPRDAPEAGSESAGARLSPQPSVVEGTADSNEAAAPSDARPLRPTPATVSASISADGARPSAALDSWIAALPYPLASVLWRYHAEADARMKMQYLAHFFEVTAQFLGVVAASALGGLHPDPVPAVASTIGAPSFVRASFGQWVRLLRQLAPTMHLMVESREDELCRLFGASKGRDLGALFGNGILHALGTASRYRNEWLAHGGVAGLDETTDRLRALEELLRPLRSPFERGFHDWRLVVPGPALFRTGRYQHEVRLLEGANSLLRVLSVETNEAMDADYLYMVDPDATAVLRLMALIKVPIQDGQVRGCYFYSRIVDQRAQFVSYSVEEGPVVMREADEVRDAVALLDALSLRRLPMPPESPADS